MGAEYPCHRVAFVQQLLPIIVKATWDSAVICGLLTFDSVRVLFFTLNSPAEAQEDKESSDILVSNFNEGRYIFTFYIIYCKTSILLLDLVD